MEWSDRSPGMGRSLSDEPEAILLVKDEPLVRLDLAEMLEDAGYQVLEAANADIALKVLTADPDRVTILMTDVNMPGSIDGLELARIVHAQWPHIRIVVTSGQVQPSDGTIPVTAASSPSRFSQRRWCAPSWRARRVTERRSAAIETPQRRRPPLPHRRRDSCGPENYPTFGFAARAWLHCMTSLGRPGLCLPVQ
jgi:CheY-like chemotaxis protein